MSFDPVHDTQRAYRVLLDCMARPGTVGGFGGIIDRLDLEAPLSPGLLLMGLTLLDGETSFAVPSEGHPEASAAALADIESFLARICSSRIEAAEKAAFIFLPRVAVSAGAPGGCAVSSRAAAALETASRGTLIDPHLGATVFLEIRSLGKKVRDSGDAGLSGREGSWILEGPGIAGAAELRCCRDDVPVMKEALLARERACSEFPLGVDLIILDRDSDIVCVPRTSSVREA